MSLIHESILINTQLALFLNDAFVRPDKLVAGLNEIMGSVFNAAPTILPIPDLPGLEAAPMVQMKSSDGVYSCDISRVRVDFCLAGIGNQKFADLREDFINKATACMRFLESNSITVKRLGFISRFFVEERSAFLPVANLLKPEFCQTFLGDGHEVFLRYVSRTQMFSMNVNNFTTLEKFSARILGQQQDGILIVRDFNSIPEDDYPDKISSGMIRAFITNSEAEFKLTELQRLLWPAQ